MADCFPIQDITDFAARNKDVITGNIAKVLIRKSPYINSMKSGTIPNDSNVIRVVTQERAAMAASLVRPNFVPDISMCRAGGGKDRVGSTEYTIELESLRGEGPDICVKLARTAFRETYLNMQEALTNGIVQVINSDIRVNYNDRSGIKYVVRSGFGFETNLTGEQQAVDTPYVSAVPDSPLSVKLLLRLRDFLEQDMLADPHEMEDGGGVFKFIGSSTVIEKMRNELNVQNDVRSLTNGSFKMGEKAITGYKWMGPYRGLVFGVDPQPLRFSLLNADGQPDFIEPEVAEDVTNGVGSRRNPLWVNASYEVGFLMGADHFERWVPNTYKGEGKMKFNPMGYNGELTWHYVIDNDCNKFGDVGRFIYEISRAYRPKRPHAVVAIAFKRCNDDLDLTPCSFYSASNSL